MSLIKTNTVLNQAEKISMNIQSLVLYFEVNIVLVMINLKQLLRSHTLFAGQQSVSLLLKSHVNVPSIPDSTQTGCRQREKLLEFGSY